MTEGDAGSPWVRRLTLPASLLFAAAAGAALFGGGARRAEPERSPHPVLSAARPDRGGDALGAPLEAMTKLRDLRQSAEGRQLLRRLREDPESWRDAGALLGPDDAEFERLRRALRPYWEGEKAGWCEASELPPAALEVFDQRMRLKAWWLARQGRIEDALTRLTEAARYGAWLRGLGADPGLFARGDLIVDRALAELRELAAQATGQAEALVATSQSLASLELEPALLRALIAETWARRMATAEDIAAGDTRYLDGQRRDGAPPQYSAADTQAALTALCLQLLEACDAPYAELADVRGLVDPVAAAEAPDPPGTEVWRKRLLRSVTQELAPLLLLHAPLGRAKVRLTRVALAAQAHRIAEGAWAPDAAALSASFPSGWLLDPYSGEPLNYSGEHRATWTVGENGRDDLGGFDDWAVHLDDEPPPEAE